jgi:hypothetical protein
MTKSRNTSNSMMMMMMMMMMTTTSMLMVMLVVVEVVNFQTSIRVSRSARTRHTEICCNSKAKVLTKQQINKQTSQSTNTEVPFSILHTKRTGKL